MPFWEAYSVIMEKNVYKLFAMGQMRVQSVVCIMWTIHVG